MKKKKKKVDGSFGFTSIAIELPEEKFKIEHMLQGLFWRNIICHFGVKGIHDKLCLGKLMM